MKPRLIFVTKPECELCEAGVGVVARAAAWLRFDLQVVKASSDPRLDRFSERLPVVLDADGVLLLEGRIGFGQALRTLVRHRLGRF